MAKGSVADWAFPPVGLIRGSVFSLTAYGGNFDGAVGGRTTSAISSVGTQGIQASRPTTCRIARCTRCHLTCPRHGVQWLLWPLLFAAFMLLSGRSEA